MFYSLGGTSRIHDQQGRVDSDISLDLDWQDYEASGFDSQVWGNMTGAGRYALFPIGWSGCSRTISARAAATRFRRARRQRREHQLLHDRARTDAALRRHHGRHRSMRATPTSGSRTARTTTIAFEGGLTSSAISRRARAPTCAATTRTCSSTTAPPPRISTRPTCWRVIPTRAPHQPAVEAGYSARTGLDTQSGPIFKLR